jgi:hypothetical protein
MSSQQLTPCEISQIQFIVGPKGTNAGTLQVVRRYAANKSIVTLISVSGASSPHINPDVLGQWLDRSREWIGAHSQYEVSFEQSPQRFSYSAVSSDLGGPHYILVASDARLYEYFERQGVGGNGLRYGLTGYPGDSYSYSVTLLSPPGGTQTNVRELTGAPATEACQLQVHSVASAALQQAMRDQVHQNQGTTDEADQAVSLLNGLGQEVLCNSFGLAAVNRWGGVGFPAYSLGEGSHVLSSNFAGVTTYPYVLKPTQAFYESLPVKAG